MITTIFSSSDDWDKVYDQKVTIFDGNPGKTARAQRRKSNPRRIVPAFGSALMEQACAMTGFDNKTPVVFVYEIQAGAKLKDSRSQKKEEPCGL